MLCGVGCAPHADPMPSALPGLRATCATHSHHSPPNPQNTHTHTHTLHLCLYRKIIFCSLGAEDSPSYSFHITRRINIGKKCNIYNIYILILWAIKTKSWPLSHNIALANVNHISVCIVSTGFAGCSSTWKLSLTWSTDQYHNNNIFYFIAKTTMIIWLLSFQCHWLKR